MTRLLFFVLLAVVGLTACGDDFENLTPQEYATLNGLQTAELDQGVLIVVDEEGNEDKPTLDDELVVNYVGRLTDGTQFDAGNNVRFPLNALITGWQIGLQEVGEGGKCTLIIPSEAGYGPSGTGSIPGGATLVFDIEVIFVGTAADEYVETNNLNTTLLSEGVHIVINNPGNDIKPTLQDSVRVNYSGKLIDGSTFDARQDISFALNGVIVGWQVGIQEIGEGGSCTLIIPPSAGYGNQQNGSIPPSSVLIFDVDLLEVK